MSDTKATSLLGLCEPINTNLRRVENNEDIPEAKVEVGGLIITVDGSKVSLGPEVIESFKRIEAEKRQAFASGKPFANGHWQTQELAEKALIGPLPEKQAFPACSIS